MRSGGSFAKAFWLRSKSVCPALKVNELNFRVEPCYAPLCFGIEVF